MSKKGNNRRRYPRTVTRVEKLPIMEMGNFSLIDAASDSSMGDSMTQSWISKDISPQAQWDYEMIIRPQELSFFMDLLAEDFSYSERNSSTAVFANLVKHYKEAVQKWIMEIYNLRNTDEKLLIQLFRLLRCFPYDFLAPASLCLAALAVHHNSDFVKSEALSLMDHWGNKDVLRIMNNHEAPSTPWLKMKYFAIIESLERYAALQENR